MCVEGKRVEVDRSSDSVDVVDEVTRSAYMITRREPSAQKRQTSAVCLRPTEAGVLELARQTATAAMRHSMVQGSIPAARKISKESMPHLTWLAVAFHSTVPSLPNIKGPPRSSCFHGQTLSFVDISPSSPAFPTTTLFMRCWCTPIRLELRRRRRRKHRCGERIVCMFCWLRKLHRQHRTAPLLLHERRSLLCASNRLIGTFTDPCLP